VIGRQIDCGYRAWRRKMKRWVQHTAVGMTFCSLLSLGVLVSATRGQAPLVPAQPAASAPTATPVGEVENLKTTPLGVRQARVERMVEDLERKFNQLAQALAKAEPERAERLAEALKQSQALGIKGRMAAITRLLDQQQLEPAKAEESKILVDIKELLALLLDEKDDKDKIREEFERLSEWKKQIEEIIQQQKGEKREADRVANKDDTLKALEAKIKAIEALVEQQKGVIAATEAARDVGIQGLGKVAGDQAKVRQGTQAVVEQIGQEAGDKPAEGKPGEGKPGEGKPGEGKPGEGKPGEGKPGEGKPGEGKPGEGKPGEGKPGEGKPGEGKPGEGKPGEGKPGEGKPGEGKPGEGKPGEGKPGEGKPGEGKPGEGKPGEGKPSGGQPSESGSQPQRPAEPGERPLQAAIQNQKQAEGKLQTGKGKAAQQDEQTALENLQRALNELKKESQRIASLPPEAFEKMAGKQDDIANQTGKLQDQMKQGPQGGGQGEGGQGQQGESGEGGGKQQPGQQKVQQAQKSMEQASGDLRKQDPDDASRKQGKAIKDLEDALREIEERLAQLREETQVEKLAKLEARFRSMLAVQKDLSARTLVIDKKKIDNMGQLVRSDRNALKLLGEEERGLAIIKQEGQADRIPLAFQAQQALDIILDDGTSVVFPDVVEQLRDDLITVGSLLGDNLRTDGYTQTMQNEVEVTLEELIEALQKAQKQKDSEGGGGGGGGGGNEPLLPSSAELKLLRAAQMRVNRRTESLEQARPADGEFDMVLKDEVRKVSERQADIGEMTLKILERSGK
jgi:uncharacterized low-complexity protein